MAINESQLALVKIQMKRATTAEWARTSDTGAAWRGYLLRQAEIGVEVFTDNTIKFKMGDGINTWYQLPYISGDSAKFVTSLPPLSTAIINTFYVLGDELYYTLDNKTWVKVGNDELQFDELIGRPKYNGSTMTSKTNIPKVPSKASELSYSNISSKLSSTNVQGAIDELNNNLANTITKIADPNILYGTDSNGDLKGYPYSSAKSNSSVAMRTNYGTLKGQDPIEPDDYVTKQYQENAINPIKTSITNMESNIRNVVETTNELDARLNTAESAIESNTTNISNITKQVNTNKSDITLIKTDISNVNGRIDSLENISEGLEDKIDTNTSNISQLQKDLQTEIEERQGQDIDTLQAGLGSNGATITITKQNGEQASASLPIANSSQNGLMPSSSFNQITQNKNDIATLKNQGGRYIGTSFDTYADLVSWTIPSTVKDADFTYVNNDEFHNGNTTMYIYDAEENGFIFAYQIEHELPGIADTEALGMVLSSSTIGQIFVEQDGTMSLNGYDGIFSTLDNKIDKVPGKDLSTNDYTDEDKAKVDSIETTGDGTTFLGSDGEYHTIEFPDNGIKDVTVDGTSVVDSVSRVANLHKVAATGSYNDLADIPTDIIKDPNYVHTDNNLTADLIQKISVIDLSGTGTKFLTDDGTYTYLSDVAGTGSYNDLLDVPTDLVKDSNYVHTDNNFTDELKQIVESVDLAGEENKIESVSVNGNGLPIDENKNVDIDLSAYALQESVPVKTSDLINDTDYVSDDNYIHTDNNLTNELLKKLEEVEAGGQVNIIETVKVSGQALVPDQYKAVNVDLTNLTPLPDFRSLSELVSKNTANIQSLTAGGIWRGIFETYADLPKVTPDESFIGGEVDINDYVIIKEDELHDGEKTRYYATGADENGNIVWTYYDMEVGTTPISTNSSLGIVQGTADSSTTKNKISVAADGTMSLNGYNDLLEKYKEYLPLIGNSLSTNPMTGMIYFADNVGGIQGQMAGNDSYRIIGRAKDDLHNSGYLEISTNDDGNEPIYVRQYSGAAQNFDTLLRSLTLLDATGNTILPGTITISNDSNSKLVMGGGSANYTWIDYRDPVNNSVLSAITLHNDGLVNLTKGRLGLGNTTEVNSVRTPPSEIKYNADEQSIEFIFN